MSNFRVFIFCIQGECSSLIGWIIVKHLTECQTWCRSGSPNSFPVAVSNRCTTGGRQIKHVLLMDYFTSRQELFHHSLHFKISQSCYDKFYSALMRPKQHQDASSQNTLKHIWVLPQHTCTYETKPVAAGLVIAQRMCWEDSSPRTSPQLYVATCCHGNISRTGMSGLLWSNYIIWIDYYAT